MEPARRQRLKHQTDALQRVAYSNSDDHEAIPGPGAGTQHGQLRATTDRASLLVRAMSRGANCRWANQAWSEFTGRSPEQTLGEGWLQDVHADDRARCAQVDPAEAGGLDFCELEYRLRRATGGFAWIHEHRVPRVRGGGVGYLATAVDVSPRKRAERHLDLVYAVDRVLAEDDSVDGHIDVILALLCKRLEWDVAELWSCDVAHEQPRCLRRWSSEGAETPETNVPLLDSPALVEGLGPEWIEDIASDRRTSGSRAARTLVLHGMLRLPVPMLGTAQATHGPSWASLRLYSRDIRARDDDVIAVATCVAARLGRALERQLPNGIPWSSTTVKSALLDHLPDAMVSVDREGRVLEINPEAEALFALPPDYALGRSFQRLVVPRRARKRFREHLVEQWAVPPRGARGAQFDSPALKADGSSFAVRFSMTAFADRDPPRITIGVHDDSPRKQVEDAATQHLARMRSLMSELLLVEERERKRLATDLHDGLSQTIALAQIKLAALRASRLAAIDGPLGELEELLEHADRAARSVGFELSPPILHDLGLEPALQWLIENIEDRYGIEVSLQRDDRIPAMDETSRVILFRAIRELLINAAKHASAQHVQVYVGSRRGRLRVQVTDDGIGMNPVAALSEGFGLLSIRERMGHIGGRMTIDATCGEGTRIHLSAPLGALRPVESRTELR